MSTIKVNQPHALPKDEAKSRLAVFEESLGKYGVKLDWSGHKAKLKGTGVSGGAEVADDNVNITVKLGFLAKAAGVDAGKLEASIKKRLAAAFEETA
ncbi:MAG: polyhydroxyalkanoic acid system family protein [Deltaproteobacteria bacterium]|nr:polyhydroxyalkanoic acid system family protein [Deltaproteobacteria bacterium]